MNVEKTEYLGKIISPYRNQIFRSIFLPLVLLHVIEDRFKVSRWHEMCLNERNDVGQDIPFALELLWLIDDKGHELFHTQNYQARKKPRTFGKSFTSPVHECEEIF